MAVNFITTMLIPRGLGPEIYGNFEFISSFFTRVVNFLNMGSSTAFYTKLSQRPREFGLVSFYLKFCGLMVFFLFLIVIVSHLLNIYTFLWPDQSLTYIYLGTIWAALTFLLQVFSKMADAYSLTVGAEILRVVQKVLGLGLIIFFFFSHKLNLMTLFLYHYILILFLSIALIRLFIKNGYSVFKSWHLSLSQIKSYGKEFFDYCHPLFTYSLVVLIVSILDRWLLQHYSGSIEQGFFGLGFKIGTICFLFTSAMTPLIHREYAIAFEKNDLKEIANLFRRYVPLLYSISAYLSCFVFINAHSITYIIGGEKFKSAVLVVSILAIYPIHQTYGQLSGAVFMATGQTKLRRNIGSFFQIVGLPLSFFVLAPSHRYGLNAGAMGLAIKILLIQFFAVNVQLFFNARMLNLRYLYYLGHQIGCIIILTSIAYIVRYTMSGMSYIVINFILSGIVYTVLVMLTLWKFPILFGLQSTDINRLLKLIRQKLF